MAMTIPIWEDMLLTPRYVILACVWAVIGICWLLIVGWMIAGAGAGGKRRLLTSIILACSMAALILTLRESRIDVNAPRPEPDEPPAQFFPESQMRDSGRTRSRRIPPRLFGCPILRASQRRVGSYLALGLSVNGTPRLAFSSTVR